MKLKNIRDKITVYTNERMDNNTIVIENDDCYFIVDPGFDFLDLKKTLNNDKEINFILTHFHFDHIGHDFKESLECAKHVYASDGLKQIINSRTDSELFGINIINNIDYEKFVFVTDLQKEFGFEFILTPGHSVDSMCIKYDDILITGDHLFSDSIGRTDFEFSDHKIMIKSLYKIKDVLKENPNILVIPGHGDFILSSDLLKKNKLLMSLTQA
ncbi:MAG: MBL fold metallo-hydrolase [Mycoplasma sp.]